MTAHPRSGERGFSLLEVIVAVGILAFITATAWYTFDGIVRLKETAEATEETTNAARVALQRVTHELRDAFLTLNPSPTSAYLTMFRGKDEEPMDSVTFNSFSHVRLYRESPEADTNELTYYGVQDPDAAGLYLLIRREAPRIDGKPDEGGTEEVLARRVREFNLRYYDHVNQEWVDGWDTLSAEHSLQLPKAVQVSLVLVDDEGLEHPYATTVLLATYKTRGNQGPLPDVKE